MACWQGENLLLGQHKNLRPFDFLTCLSLQVKKIMNRVFQSLRGQFELEESYTGREVLGTVMNTIKVELMYKISYQQQPNSNTQIDYAVIYICCVVWSERGKNLGALFSP